MAEKSPRVTYCSEEKSGLAESHKTSEETHFASLALVGLVNQDKTVAALSAYRQIGIKMKTE